MSEPAFDLANYVPTQLELGNLLGIGERTVRTLVADGWLTKGAPLHRLLSEYKSYHEGTRTRD